MILWLGDLKERALFLERTGWGSPLSSRPTRLCLGEAVG